MPCVLAEPDSGDLLLQGHTPQIGYSSYRHEVTRRCRDCGYIYFDPPSADILADYYGNEYPKIAASSYNVDCDYAPEKTAKYAGKVIQIAAKFALGNAHIFHEIGCAFGGTVDELNRRTYSTTGTDLNQAAIVRGNARGNAAIFAEDGVGFLRRTGRKPNVVFGCHVLEHLPDPVRMLSELRGCLAPEAIVILILPNAMTLYPLVYGYQSYIWFNFPAHLHLYSPGSGPCLARGAGYELLDVASMDRSLHPAATERARTALPDNPIAQLVRDHVSERDLMGEELVLVLTPHDGAIARKHTRDIAVARRLCESSREFEVKLRTLGSVCPLEALEQTASPLVEPLEEMRRRAETAEATLRAIEASTFWRATALPRWLIDQVKRYSRA